MSAKTILVGTRGSKLALAQTKQVIQRLNELDTELYFETCVIKTKGDQGQINELGAFIKELEKALIRKEVDIAIHSLKDMPVDVPEELVIAGVTEREDVRDILVLDKTVPFKELAAGNVIATGSPRRQMLLKDLNPNVQLTFIQGNVDSRIAAVRSGKVNGVVLALAGLKRLNITNEISEYFSIEDVLPAPGQGAVAIETRTEATDLIQLVNQVTHRPTYWGVKTERMLLRKLGGGCLRPIGAYAMCPMPTSIELKAFYGYTKDHKINKFDITFEIKDIHVALEKASDHLLNNYAETEIQTT